MHIRVGNVGGISELLVTSMCFFGYPLLDRVYFIYVSIYLHRSREDHVEVVQWLIKNAKINVEIANHVLRWASE